MVKTTSIDSFIKRLRAIFYNVNSDVKRYSEVWLTKADFGGLYQSNKYLLHVKAAHNLENSTDEIKYVVGLLHTALSGEDVALIWRVIVHNINEEVHYDREDIAVLLPEYEHD